MAKKSKNTKAKATKDETTEISQIAPISSLTALPEHDVKQDKWDLQQIYDISQLQGSSPTMCDGNNCSLVACSQWKSSSQNGELWNACLDCQLERFQGWPKSKEEYPVAFVDENHRKVMMQLCSAENDAVTPRLPLRNDGNMTELEAWEMEQSNEVDSNMENPHKPDESIAETNTTNSGESNDEEHEPLPSQDDEEEPEEQWDIKYVFTIKEIENEGKKCDTKNCPLKACSIWVSSEKEEWNGCLDCQEEYYERWPEKVEDYPITFMSIEHRQIIWDQCTGKYKPDMPPLPLVDGGSMEDLYKWEREHGIGKFRVVEGDTGLSTSSPGDKVDAFGSEDMNKTKGSTTPLPPSSSANMTRGVTPSPHPPNSKKANAKEKMEKNKQRLQLHEKWQKEADRLGGGKIIVNKEAAKSTIFDFLRDAFRPMNITEIYTGLKASVPNQMVKMCLDDMALDHFVKESQFFDSDDENDDPKPSVKSGKSSEGNIIPSDIYAGSLCLKKGRNVNTTLYYVDYTKQFNDGNGLLPEDRNELFSKHASADAEKSSTENKIKRILSDADVLLSQPTNVDLASRLETLDTEVESLRSQMEVANSFKDNEKIRKQTRKKIDVMQAQWRKRKRLCMDFLCMMEEMTEGTISMKKSLVGDGPIELESDESAIKGSILFNQKKRQRDKSLRRLDFEGASKKQRTEFSPDDSFIGVELTSSGIKRVYLNEV